MMTGIPDSNAASMPGFAASSTHGVIKMASRFCWSMASMLLFWVLASSWASVSTSSTPSRLHSSTSMSLIFTRQLLDMEALANPILYFFPASVSAFAPASFAASPVVTPVPSGLSAGALFAAWHPLMETAIVNAMNTANAFLIITLSFLNTFPIIL